MPNSKILKYTLSLPADLLLPALSVDCVIFGFHNGTMKVLLNRFKKVERWMLPGGFILKDENVDDAAIRILKSRTSLENVFLKQFHLFGDFGRVKPEESQQILKIADSDNKDISELQNHWYLQRFVSIGYYALVEYSKVKIKTNADEEIAWFSMNEIPTLYGDHNTIIEKALSTIRQYLPAIPMGYELLPQKFTMTDLRLIYETILGRPLDRRNFQRKILSTGLVCKLNEKNKKFGIKSSTLFSFNKEKYEEYLQDGFLTFR